MSQIKVGQKVRRIMTTDRDNYRRVPQDCVCVFVDPKGRFHTVEFSGGHSFADYSNYSTKESYQGTEAEWMFFESAERGWCAQDEIGWQYGQHLLRKKAENRKKQHGYHQRNKAAVGAGYFGR